MNLRPLLDEASFQKLLHAAWVLQCERDLARMELLSRPIPLPVKGESIAVVPTGATAIETGLSTPTAATFEPPVSTVPVQHKSAKLTEASQETPVVIPSLPVGPVHPQVAVAGALALARTPRIPRNQDLVVFAPLAKKPAARARLSRATLTLERVEQRLAKPVVKVIIPKGTPQNVASLTGPVIVLVVLTLLLMQLFAQRAGWQSVKAAAEFVVSAVDHISEVHAGYTGNAGRNALRMESSHRRVTDTEVASAVEELSNYEMKTIRRQAEYGDDVAEMTLGMAYEMGSDVPQNCTLASHWVAMAAADGNAAAEYNLGLRYTSGDGIAVNRGEARRWLGSAAKHGYPEAANALRMVP
jgi:hypothetical protein